MTAISAQRLLSCYQWLRLMTCVTPHDMRDTVRLLVLTTSVDFPVLQSRFSRSRLIFLRLFARHGRNCDAFGRHDISRHLSKKSVTTHAMMVTARLRAVGLARKKNELRPFVLPGPPIFNSVGIIVVTCENLSIAMAEEFVQLVQIGWPMGCRLLLLLH
jgi:hypothetical protein